MSFRITKILFRCSTTLSKNHYHKFTRDHTNVFQRYSIHCTHLRWVSSGKKNIPEFQDDFEQFEVPQVDYSDIDYDAITDGDAEKLKSLRLLQLEIDVLAQQGEKVPSRILTEQWRELLSLNARNHRMQYLRFLWVNQMKKESDKRKKDAKREQYLKVIEERKTKERTILTTDSPVEYGLNSVTLVHRIREGYMNRYYNFKLLQAMMFGPQIIVDCGYEDFMSTKEINLCSKQVLLMWSENRDHFYPFDVLFCNVQEKSPMLRKLRKVLPSIDEDPSFPFNYTSKNYLDLYPKEQLVYLTPHCREKLDTYNGNDVYIIGALVDRSNCEPLSLAKAKREGIRTAKFPIDDYLNWGIGVKSLTLNQCLGIMNDKKDGRDWNYAFRHIPKRKLLRNFMDEEKVEEKNHKFSAKYIREQYRRNIVYDLLLKDKAKTGES